MPLLPIPDNMEMVLGALFVIVLPFGGAFALSMIVERMLRRNMSSIARGAFVLTVGYLALQGLLFVGLSTCGMFGGECP